MNEKNGTNETNVSGTPCGRFPGPGISGVPGPNYIKIINNVKHELNGIRGYLPSKIMNWVLNIRAGRYQHPIYFSRHGQSAYAHSWTPLCFPFNWSSFPIPFITPPP